MKAVPEFVKEYMSIKEEEISLGDTGFNPIIRICKLSSKKKNESRIDDNNQEMNINEQDEQSGASKIHYSRYYR